MTPMNAVPQGPRGDAHDPSSPMRTHSRTHSMSSDRPSLTGYGGLLSPPTTTNPEPIYIAASAASQIVTNDHDSHSETWFDQHGIEPSGETALVNNGALKLVNNFLDQLLFNFLSVSRSTSLASLRPAVSEVLKPKLAKDAIGLADQELLEYLGGGEDEELLAFHNGLEPSGDWDLELVWKRTRLRCMVYSSLGDMEEEDEDHYTELEQLDGPPGSNNRFSNNPGVVSPAVAIFLTSILEFMGEQVLVVAGQAAYDRLRLKHEKEEREGVSEHAEIADRVVVAEMDMERVALDRTLGRLWRGWKKRIRSPTPSMSMPRSFSRESVRSRGHSRMSSIEPLRRFEQVSREPTTSDPTEHQHAASIPLPIGNDDVREIEIPGVAYHSDDEEDEPSEDEFYRQPRPKSMMVPLAVKEPLMWDFLEAPSPAYPAGGSRKRSHSLPSELLYSSNSTFKRTKMADNEAEARENETEPAKAELDEGKKTEDTDAIDENSTVHTEESEHKREIEEKPISEIDKGKLAAVFAGVAAAGAAALAGITAVAKGGAPETVLTPGEESDVEEGFVGEEPEILTSERVSVHEKVVPEHGATTSRPGSVYAPSVNSLKLVDVSSPRSPTRSRGGSLASVEPVVAARQVSVSRSGSSPEITTEAQVPRGTSPIQRVATGSPIVRNTSALSTRAVRNSASDSISELEEEHIDPPKSLPAAPVVVPERSLLREAKVPASASALKRENEKASAANSPSLSQRSFTSSHSTSVRPLRETSLVEPKSLANPSMMAQPVGAKGVDGGATTLGPLRELIEVGQDHSDEASSIALSYRAQNGSSSTVSVSGVPRSQQYPDANRLSDQSKLARNGPGERPRISPSQTQQDEDNAPRPDTSSKSNRRLHTSSSSTSSGSHKVRPIRTSEDSMPSPGLDKARTFEQLIQSDQTIQYTLTPKNMREMESPDSPRAASLTQPPSMLKGGERPRTGSVADRSAALHSNPPSQKIVAETATRPIANSGAKVKLNVQARDARIERDSIGDFAEFIRSTGPSGATVEGSQPRSAVVNVHRGQNGSARNTSASSRRTATPNGLTNGLTNGPPTPPKNAVTNGVANRTPNGTPRRSQSSATRLQAREAVVPYGDSSSDLVDFIRQGPPTDNGNPRIPRTAAMSGAVGVRAMGDAGAEPRHSHASTNETSMRSVQSSVNSQSALLNNHSAKKPSLSAREVADDDMMPKRKTRRVKDPYAIDLSDEDEELAVAKIKPARQESLVDFLKNVPPPPDRADSPSVAVSSKAVGRKSSAPSLISRLSRNSVSHGKNLSNSAATRANKEEAPQTVSKSSGPAAATSDGTKRPLKSHSHNAQSNNATNYISRLDNERRPARPAQKLYEPRDAVGSRAATRSTTHDLADFLKNTEPPPSNGPQRLSLGGLEPKEEGRFERMFGRRKKAAAA